ncbi:MAG: hypothetical protein IJ688_12970 [Treponema sp.]|nr:hypothetical protein [Treponema sp.]
MVGCSPETNDVHIIDVSNTAEDSLDEDFPEELLGKTVSLTAGVNDVSNYYKIENNILTFDTVQGPAYEIDLDKKVIKRCTSSGSIMSTCLETSPKVWEIALYSDELPKQVVYIFNEKRQTIKQVCGSGGGSGGIEPNKEYRGKVSYADGTYEEMVMNNSSGEIEIRYYKKDGLLLSSLKTNFDEICQTVLEE